MAQELLTRMCANDLGSDSNPRRAPSRAAAEEMLREIAYVLALTRRVRNEIEEGRDESACIS